MKLYVLDEPPPAEEELPAPQGAPRSRIARAGGAIVGLLIVGAVSVAGLGVSGPDTSSAAVAERDVAVAVTAPLAGPPVAPTANEQGSTFTPLQDSRAVTSESAPVESSSIVRRAGKIFVDLHQADVGSALAMMSQATRTTVQGAELLREHPARLTAQLTATSPQMAWQSVFGNVANFALTCVADGCVVRIVSALRTDVQPVAAIEGNAGADASASALQPEVSLDAAAAAVRQQQQTVYSEDY